MSAESDLDLECPGCGRSVESGAQAARCVANGCEGPIPSSALDSSQEATAAPDGDESQEADQDLVEIEIEAGRTIPDWIQDQDLWVLWDMETKMPRAPWRTGSMAPARWGQEVEGDQRPETTYERADGLGQLGVDGLGESFGWEHVQPEEVRPTILLPHDPQDRWDVPLMYVDFDDVVIWEDGSAYTSQEVWGLVEALDGYTELSSSGEGLHVLVRAELPGGLGRFIADLDYVGGIEMYDHGRFLGATWEHVKGTPVEIPERNGVVEWIIRRLESEDQAERRKNGPSRSRSGAGKADALSIEDLDQLGGSSDTNAYYDLPVLSVAESHGHFARHEHNGAGPHPDHGPQSGSKWADQCDNFAILSDTHWFCRWHGVSGTALDLIAVCDHGATCSSCGMGISDLELLQACVTARDKYADGKLDDAKPPYRALQAIARITELRVSEDGSLPKWTASAAREIYDNASIEEIQALIREYRQNRRTEGGSEGSNPRGNGPKEGAQA